MIILGIDPGTITMGYGIIETRDDDEVSPVDFGALSCAKRSPLGERLYFMYAELGRIIGQFRPAAVAIEQPFVAKNVKTALVIGRAQAVAILAAAGGGIATYEYTPTQVKQRIANYGASSKTQVQEMVRLQLGLREIPQPADAADALAVAICHWREMHLKELLSGQR